MAIESNVTKATGIISSGLKSLKIGQSGSSGGGSPPISCAFPLNAAAGEITGAGHAGKLTMTESDQTGSYAVVNTNQSYAAAPTGFLTQTSAVFDYSTAGKKAVELQVQQLDGLTGGSTGVLFTGLALVTQNLASFYRVRVQAQDDGTFSVFASGFTGAGFIATGLGTPPSDVAIVYDGDADSLYVRYAGSNYFATSVTLGNVFAALESAESAVNVADVGKIARGRAETQAASYNGSYESGTTDPCGNTI